MPIEKFRVLDTWENTLTSWARKLEYLFVNLGDDNIGSYTPGTDSIKDYMIDFGLGLQQVSADDVPILDSGGYYTSTGVEGALSEIRYGATASTGAVLPNYGLSIVSANAGSGSNTFTMSAPYVGAVKKLYCSLANTSDMAVVYSGSTATFIGPGTGLRLKFTQPGQVAQLIGVSTSRWGVMSLGSTTVTTALPTITT